MRLYPTDPRLYRHRGHRYITVRELDRAQADLERAAEPVKGQPDEVEPDGQPNARGIPTSTLHTNIWYHLALARYLKAISQAPPAIGGARGTLERTRTTRLRQPLALTALRRADRAAEARAVLDPIRADLDVIENGGYHALLLLYKGERKADAVLAAAGEGAAGTAVRYGVSAWHLVEGRRDEAKKLWDQILAGPDWPSFGYIAAEARSATRRQIAWRMDIGNGEKSIMLLGLPLPGDYRLPITNGLQEWASSLPRSSISSPIALADFAGKRSRSTATASCISSWR